MSHSLWSRAALYGEIVLQGVRLYAGGQSKAAAAILFRYEYYDITEYLVILSMERDGEKALL